MSNMPDLSRVRPRAAHQCSGAETVFGAGQVSEEVMAAIAALLPHSVDMAGAPGGGGPGHRPGRRGGSGVRHQLQLPGIVVAAAAWWTGSTWRASSGSPIREVAQRGGDPEGPCGELQFPRRGRSAPDRAEVVEFGAAAETGVYQLEAVLSANTAAAVYVISHRCVRTGMIALPGSPPPAMPPACPSWSIRPRSRFARLPRRRRDLVIFSAQKAMGRPRRGSRGKARSRARLLRRAARHRRPMKAGKEAVIGAMAALERWAALGSPRDHGGGQGTGPCRRSAPGGAAGLQPFVVPDKTAIPSARWSSQSIRDAPASAPMASPGRSATLAPCPAAQPLRRRDILPLDLRRMDEATLELVCGRIAEALRTPGQEAGTPPAPADQSAASMLAWLATAEDASRESSLAGLPPRLAKAGIQGDRQDLGMSPSITAFAGMTKEQVPPRCLT